MNSHGMSCLRDKTAGRDGIFSTSFQRKSGGSRMGIQVDGLTGRVGEILFGIDLGLSLWDSNNFMAGHIYEHGHNTTNHRHQLPRLITSTIPENWPPWTSRKKHISGGKNVFCYYISTTVQYSKRIVQIQSKPTSDSETRI